MISFRGAGTRSRVVVKSLCVAFLVVVLSVVPVLPALAHATLLQTTPADGSVVADGPAEVTLTFDQGVSTAPGAVKVLAPDGSRVDTGTSALRDGGRLLAESLHPDLPPGTYTILWRVISADTHTVFGAQTFSVRTASASAGAQAARAAQAGAGEAAGKLLDFSRLVFYVGLLALLGGLAFVFVLWPAGAKVRSVRQLLWINWCLAVLGTIGGLLMQGPYSEGLGLYYTFDPELIRQVVGTRFGVITIARLALLVVLASALASMRRVRRAVAQAALGLTGIGLLLTTSAIGHAGSGDLAGFAFPADILHLAAAGAWMGGLAVLAAVLLRQPPEDLPAIMPRWSRYAEMSVVVLVITGTFASWRQVREWGALTHTTYGLLLLGKVASVVAMLALGAVGRRRVQRHFAMPVRQAAAAVGATHVPAPKAPGWAPSTGNSSDHHRFADSDRTHSGSVITRTLPRPTPVPPAAPEADPDLRWVPVPAGWTVGAGNPGVPLARVRTLRVSVTIEAMIAVIVLGVTAVLVSTIPADESYFPTFAQRAAVTNALQVHVEVAPARAGLDGMHVLYTDNGGSAADVVQSTARWTLLGGDNVVPVRLRRTSAGHYDLDHVELSTVGTWQLAISTQTSEIDSSTTLFTVRIR